MKVKMTSVSTDFFEKKQSELTYFGNESSAVKNEMALAINSMKQINTNIETSLKEISEKKASLTETEQRLYAMKAENDETIKKYASLFPTETEE